MSDIINTKPDLSMKPDLGTKKEEKKEKQAEKKAEKKAEKAVPAKSESEADMQESAFGKALEGRYLNDADRAILVRLPPPLLAPAKGPPAPKPRAGCGAQEKELVTTVDVLDALSELDLVEVGVAPLAQRKARAGK